MTRGILLMAWGKRGYGFMAHNLAVSIKHHSPGIPIHLIATEKVLKEVTDRSMFDLNYGLKIETTKTTI